MSYPKFTDLVGHTLVAIKQGKNRSGNDTLTFETTEGRKFMLYHEQDCCESVYIESITGDLNDLIGEPILSADESSHSSNEEGSQTWTFYKLATRKGYVDIRWYGSSTGYYSESVYFTEIK